MKLFRSLSVFMLLSLLVSDSWAGGNLSLEKVVEDVYAIVGDLGNRSASNLGNNATFGFVVTTEGVVVIDSGGSYKGAQALHQLIQSVTDKPVVTVINSGGQDHRWLGNGYFKQQGAHIIASADAVTDQKTRVQDQFSRLGNLLGDTAIEGTEAVYADQTFDQQLDYKLGDTIFNIRHAGAAHTPGDSFVWLPQKNLIFTGDIVYTQRMLSVGTQSNSKSWIKAYNAMAAYQPQHLIPGHGRVSNLTEAAKDTRDYLVYLRKTVAEFMENGGDIAEIGSVEQEKFDYLLNYELLSGRNAQQVFIEMEWE